MGPTKGGRPDLANELYGLLTFAIEFLFQAVTVVSDSFVIPWTVACQGTSQYPHFLRLMVTFTQESF